MNVPIRERSDGERAAYRAGFMAGMEQAARIASREGYSIIADAIKSFAEASAKLLNELMPK